MPPSPVTEPYVIAIDGVSGSGKSSSARRVAAALGILYLDTGAMYRAVTHFCQRRGINPENEPGVAEMVRTMGFEFSPEGNLFVNGEDVARAIRTPEVSGQVSQYCALPVVRETLVPIQRSVARAQPAILDGRDIGTVVFPGARFKFFLWASPEIRAERRLLELKASGHPAGREEVLANLIERDRLDSAREHSPLKKAADAVYIDTTRISFDEQVARILDQVRASLKKPRSATPTPAYS